MKEQLGPRSLLRNIKESVPAWSNTIPEIPILAHRLLEQATTGKLQLEWKSGELRRLRKEVRRANRRTISAIVGTGLIVSSAIIYGLDGYAPAMVLGAPLLTWLMAGLGVAILVACWTDDNPSDQ
jgi:ubiquinone biosynthesis protein